MKQQSEPAPALENANERFWRLSLALFAYAGALVLVGKTWVTSSQESLAQAISRLGDEPWFQVTLLDTYLGFFFIWLVIAWRQSTWTARLLWGLAVASLGNIAIGFYVGSVLLTGRGHPAQILLAKADQDRPRAAR